MQAQVTVWEAFNEPVVDITDEQASNIVLASVVIIAAAWIAPYWGTTPVSASSLASNRGTIFEQMATVSSRAGTVAGATTDGQASDEATLVSAPDWYYVVQGLPSATVASFAAGANEVLDISQPVKEVVEFYEPGTSAIWNEWLNMMRDPGTPEF